ncbi:GRP1 [Candida oxycetoniae]|uniref:GRP1 n=1 Tax=Candida oxycetoniae TaxID=497107 RepID=A0AAI9SZ41_9ASCO|nr:GRP1 [Candida oxycetoniae]KAI3405808.2 GRP1 [Candida oxycetoniae]
MPKVFITGATGFIAQHIVKIFLSHDYEVIGTVRSASKGEQLKQSTIEYHHTSKFSYEIVADIAAPRAFDSALEKHKNIDFLLHTASPFNYTTTEPEKDLIIPAIQGTKNILEAAHSHCSKLKRIVLTSSDSAIYSNVDERNNKLFFNEQSWNNVKYADAVKDAVSAYYGSKSFAEKLAWEFIAMERPCFDLVSINPSYVFGPQAYVCDARNLNVSNAYIGDLLNKKKGVTKEDDFYNEIGSFIDVRDVAKAHLFAAENKEASGRRLFMREGVFSVQMMLDIINENWPQLGLITGNPGNGEKDVSVLATIDNSETKKFLPWSFISLKTSVINTVEQILNNNTRV